MGFLTAFVRGKDVAETDAVKDTWAAQPGFFPDEFAKHARDEDDRVGLALKVSRFWRSAFWCCFAAFLVASAWGIHGSLRPDIETRFVLVDRRSGDPEEVEAAGNITPPDVMMARELRWWIGRCVLAAGFDKVDETSCGEYRDRFLLDNSLGHVTEWRRRAEQRGERLRIVNMISRKQGGSRMAWDARFSVAAWDGPNFIRKYNVDIRVKFEYRQPKLGIFFDDDSGIFVRELLIDEERV